MRNDGKMPNQTSFLTHPVAIGLWLLFCILGAFFGAMGLSLFFGFIFSVTGLSFLWGRAALSRLKYDLSVPKSGIFPGQTIEVKRTVKNEKLLPLIWLELLEPCDPSGAAVPEAKYITLKPDVIIPEGEKPKTDSYCAFYNFSLLKWHQSISFADTWRASRRGIHEIPGVSIRSGDGFGLCAKTKQLSFDPPRQIVVYPKLTDVSIDKILMDMWDTRSGAFGYLEDITIVKSVRPYALSDPAKRINQRLLARGLGLNVNQYEVVSPNSVLFILDCASFKEASYDDFELTLSILSSLIVSLFSRKIEVGLFIPESPYFKERFILPSCDQLELSSMLKHISGVSKDSPPISGSFFYPTPELLGQTYYVTYDEGSSTSLCALSAFPIHKTQLLTFTQDSSSSGFKTRSLKSLWRAL